MRALRHGAAAKTLTPLPLAAMDLDTLKLHLIGRIASMDDEARLLALKRVLDGPHTYDPPSEHLTVVKESAPPYEGHVPGTYTREQVQRILEEDRNHRGSPAAPELSDEELALLDERRERHLKGESRSYTWEQAEEIMRKDLER